VRFSYYICMFYFVKLALSICGYAMIVWLGHIGAYVVSSDAGEA